MDVHDCRIFVEPQQGASYGTQLALATAAERLGFGAFFRSDHYLKMGPSSGLPGPTDSWVTLAGLARETSSIRLGTLVSSATFRYPGPLAVAVAQVDEMSGGRVELGLGAGWYEAEHLAHAIPFPPIDERFDRLEEQLQIITGLWETPTGESFDFAGEHYRVVESPGLPKPVQQPRPPLVLGGMGPRRTPALAARFADEFNVPFASLTGFVTQVERVRHACEAVGRDPDSVIFSVALVVCIGATDADFRRRAAAIDREPEELRATGLAGLPQELVADITRWTEAGAQRIYFQVLDQNDLDHIELLAEAIAIS